MGPGCSMCDAGRCHVNELARLPAGYQMTHALLTLPDVVIVRRAPGGVVVIAVPIARLLRSGRL